MRNKTLLNFLSIIFLFFLFIGQSIADDKTSSEKNIGKFTSVSENGNQKDLQGASTAIITSTNKGGKIGGFTHPYNGNAVDLWAGTFNGTVDGNAVNFYCIDIDHGLVYNQDYTDEGSTPIEITYILNNYYPYVSLPYTGSLGSEKDEASAIQATLWHYADGLDASTIGNATIRNRVNEIIADANANASSAVYPDYFTISPSSRDLNDGVDGDFIISAFDINGDPFEGMIVNLSTTSGNLSANQVTTDVNGVASFSVSQDGESVALITASAQAIIPHGTQYFHVARPDGQQKLVLATPTIASSEAQASITWTADACDDGDGDANTATFDGFSFLFNGATNNGDGTSTWSYTVTGVGASKDLSHWVLALCDDHEVLSANLDWEVNTDPRTGVYGIKWDNEINKNGGTKTFTFVLNGEYTVGTVEVAFKAGRVNYYCSINGPSCEINPKASLGDKVWYDTNENGIQDSGEAGVPNVTVKLFSCADLELATTTTNGSGNYSFNNLDAGDYYVQFVLPSGYEFTAKNAGTNPAVDSDADLVSGKTECTTLEAGEDDHTWDAGIYAPECKNEIGDFVWHDKNVNGIQDAGEVGIGNVIVELYSAGVLVATNNTTSAGYYEFTGLENGTYTVKISDLNFVSGAALGNSDSEKWYLTYANQGNSDALDNDGDENNSAEVTINCEDDYTIDFGFFHTCVTLVKSGPESVTAGDLINYTFSVINCGDLPLKGGATVYDPMLSQATDHNLQYLVVESGSTETFTRTYTTTDAECGTTIVNEAWVIGHPKMPDGSYKDNIRYDDSHSVDVICETKASLGDQVWYDEDEDGIQDLGEDGIKNVTVNLYDCGSQFIATTTTDNDGYYLFDNLEPGSYLVEFVLPNGYLFTLQNQGGNSALDSDADVIYGKTVCTTLEAGEDDDTWDAGMYVEAVNDFDLSIVKTASNTNPDDEALVTYTITVTNISSVDGTSITVSDVLPSGLIYQSSSPAGYNDVTGIWNVGDLDAGDSKSLDITIKVDYLSLGEAPIFDLGIAAPFNLFVLKDVVQPSSDTEGKVAVGRNATFGAYSVGDKLPLSGGTEDVLIVGRKLTYTSGQVYGGNVVYGQYLDVQQQNLCSDGSIRQENPTPVDFAQAETDLNALSSQLATKAATGTTTFEWGGLTLDGTEPILNVFEVDGNDLSAANSMTINVPNGSVVLVNINRKDVSWTGGLVVNGTAIGNVLYNFHRAKTLYIQGIDIRGSVLAPKAKVNFVTGVINGQMICKYFEGQGQMNNSLFHGNIHGNPEITNCAEIQGYDQVDVDASNNISCAPIVVNVDYDPNNGDDSGDDGSQWVEYGGTGLNEMIWSMYQSNAGLYIGTVGGNIYLNNGTDFELLNADMTVGYIWSLYEFNGIIYAGTDFGLYSYDGSVWTKVAIDGDVRSITSLNNVLYAAVWGGGVFASSDNGATWTAINEGLLMSGYAVQTLTVTDNNLFVGTFALGVLKYDFTTSTWVELPVGYPFIWSLATDVDNNIFAATSGGGVYASADEGENWVQLNTGLPNMHVYSVSVYGNDIYVSTWSGGVYKFVTGSLGKADSNTPSVATTPIAGSWSGLGMGGIEVSSIMVDATTQTLFAGTSTGTIYKKLDGVTDVNTVEALPTEFGLAQNYPNPFNPSTRIEFSIAEAGLYAVKVFNVLGQEVATVANQDFAAGNYTFNFDASNLTSGIYFYKLVGNNVNMTKKMMLLK